MALTLTLQPALVLLGNLHHQGRGMLEGREVWEDLDILSQAEQDLQLFKFFAQLQQYGSFVAPRVGPYDELEGASGAVPQIRPECVLVVAREVAHHLLQVQTEVVRAFVDGQMLGLGHACPPYGTTSGWGGKTYVKTWGATPPRPPRYLSYHSSG